ncbi:MAG TPA: hypothetical protein VKA21_09180 [Candidatus Binatia bacterium]|nr:hypothetical protein [Candidatus Binatia bacterium]
MRGSRRLAALVGLALVAAATAARATTVDDVCAPGSDPCVLDKTVAVTTDSTLDFGTRALEVRQRGVLDVGTGTMTIRAGSLTVVPGGSLLGRGATGGTIVVVTTGAIAIQASGTTQSRIDVSGESPGGRIELTAGSAVTLAGNVIARATTTAGRGGIVIVRGGTDLDATGPITVTGGGQAVGGDVDLAAPGALTLGGVVDVSGGGGGGGTITLDAGNVSTTNRLDASARTGGGDGGSISITASGSISLRGPVVAESVCSITSGCASTGGELALDAGGTLTIAAQITLSGAGPDGTGGTIEAQAGGDVVQTALVLVDGKGASGCGGEIAIGADGNVTLGAIDATGGFCGGGTIGVDAGQVVALPGDLNADSRTTGPGGEISIAGGDLSVTGKVHANGPSLTGGAVTLDGCDIDVPAGGQVQTKGNQGATVFFASGQITIGGALASGGTAGVGGKNELRYRDAATPPTILGTASVVPSATLVNQPELLPCGGVLPPGCGNRQLDPGEDCDDGNTTACDGCSATCLREGCGNGTTECSEQCDDQNTTACDGCSATCKTERCGNGVIECTEDCDDGAANGGPTCDTTCHVPPPPDCGNGTPNEGEDCDDGNTTPCDGCSATCRTERCGNGVQECGEPCDDGNEVACDGCNACRVEKCGDGILECDEECDDGALNGTPGAACDVTCHRSTICGITTTDPPCVPCARDTDCDAVGRCGGGACAGGVCVRTTPVACEDGDLGTADRCVLDPNGLPTCTHSCLVDAACDDGNPCSGVETCLDGVCQTGTPPTCDDDDPCTDDACVLPGGCVHAAHGGLPGIACRVDAMRAAVADAPADQIARRLRNPLLVRLDRLRGRIAAAAAAESLGDVARERRQLGRVGSQLVAVANMVGRARKRGRVSPGLGDKLATALTGAYQSVGELRASIAP